MARNWIAPNRPLTTEEMQNNALLIYPYLTQKGWSIEAISAVLGNMVYESWVNPGLWEGFNSGNLSGGYGLIQWTPATKYINWAGANWATNHYLQLDRLHYESTCGGQFWIYRNLYPGWTYEAFRSSHEDPYDLACIFAWYAEGSAVVIWGAGSKEEADRLTEEQKEANRENLRRKRGNTALDWYEFLLNNPLPPPNQRKRMPIWMMCKPIR